MSTVTSKTMSATFPPPKINSLGPSQRSRLLRSTRKLENLLGAIPQPGNFILHEKSRSQTPSPVGLLVPSISTAECIEHSEAASRAARNHTKRRSVPLPLSLHLDNYQSDVSIEHSESSLDSPQVLTFPPHAIATPSPLSPYFASEDEPMSPAPVLQATICRKRMARLTRTLGGNVSTEFTHDHLKHQRSPSEPSPHSLWPDWGENESEAESVITNDTTTLPPPTIKFLEPSHRARPLKSTRKLENLLGTTPHVEEPAVLPRATTKPRHISMISFPVSSADSPDSPNSLELPDLSQNGHVEKYSKHKSAHLPRPLILRHNNVSAVTRLNVRIEEPSSADPAQELTLPHTAIATPSPLSPLFSDEPMSPAQVPQETVRRKRMAKLTRTLGENIPTEFILPHDRLKFTQHQRSPSEPSARSLWPDWRKRESEAAVATNNNTSTTVPPPTINSLVPSQRARLLKSTRKLENLLGATPQVEESTMLPPITKSSRDISMISFPVSSADPVDSIPTSLRLSQNGPVEKHSKHKSVHLPPPLVLRHNNVSTVTKLNVRIEQSPSADSPQELTLPHTAITTPSALSPLFADEPMTPVDVPQEKIRRLRMAKLTRTLGENIPTEFILTRDHLQHQRSPSEPSPRSLWPDWTREGEGTAALDSLSKQRPRTASVIDNDPTLTNATTVPSHRSKPAIIQKLRRRHESVGQDVVLSSTLFTVTPSSPERPSSPVNHSDSDTTEDSDVDVILGSDWRGEWNIKDAQERAMVLRNLRGH